MASRAELERIRRPPPPFRRVEVEAVSDLTPFLRRVVLGGDALDGFVLEEPAASVRLVVPEPGADHLVLPEWQGNEFLYDDGSRPSIRTFTPRAFDADSRQLTIDVVVHAGGVVAEWSATAAPGDSAGFSGPGRGFEHDDSTTSYVLAGDETALPAVAQLIEWLPADVPVRAVVEIRSDDARLELGDRNRLDVEWLVADPAAAPGDRLVDALTSVALADGSHVWAAGEAAAMQRVRKLLRDDRELDRSRMTVRGYWKRRS